MRTVPGVNTTNTRRERHNNPGDLLTIQEVLAQLGVARSTLYGWWDNDGGPRRLALPNGGIRIRQGWLDDFVLGLELGA